MQTAALPLLQGIGIRERERQKSVSFVRGRARSGSAWPDSCLSKSRCFSAMLERCDQAARPFVDWSIIEQLSAEPGTPAYRLDQIDVIQPVLVAMAIAYAALWRSLGIEPAAVVGHSMGEVAAACIAGVLDLDQAMHIICRRSALMRRISGQGAMALVDLSMEEARTRLAVGKIGFRLRSATARAPASFPVTPKRYNR